MQETQIVEYKESWRDECLKWICGFANAQGGVLFIGMKDNGEVCGVKDSKKLMEDLPNKIRDTLGIICDVDLLSKNGLEYIKITTFENPYPVNYKGEYHYRSGTTKQELKGHILSRFLMQKTGLSWDGVPIANTDIEKFRNDGFDIFREQVGISARMSEKDVNLPNKKLAEKLELLSDEGFVTRAGLLVFHHNPEKWITGSWIKIGFFSDESTIVYQDEIHGSLMEQANETMDVLYTKYLIAPITYEGITRVEKYPYPKDAVREAILNAIVHKNYASFTPIQIRVYKDKMRIANDFILPPGITGEQLINEGKSRPGNPKIANTFFRAGFIESWGRGIKEIRSICKDYGAKEPEFKVDQDCVFVTFYPLNAESENATLNSENATLNLENATLNSENATLNSENATLNSLDKQIIDAIIVNPNITYDELSAITTKDRATISRHIGWLQEKGIIKRSGSKKTGSWIVRKM